MSPTHPLFPLSGDSRQARAMVAVRLDRQEAYRTRAVESRLVGAMEADMKGDRLTRTQRRALSALHR